LGVEDGQGNRWSDASQTGAGLEEIVDAERLEAGEADQVHARVEARLGLIDAPGSGFGTGPRRDDIGSPSEELQRQVLRQPLGSRELGGWTRDREAPIGTCTEQRRNRVRLQANALIDREEVALRCRLPRLDLAHTCQGLETEIVPLAEERHGLGSNS